MQRTEMKDWILMAAHEACKKAASERLTEPYHFDIYDDCGHGRVCSFETTATGKLLWFNFNGDVPEHAECSAPR